MILEYDPETDTAYVYVDEVARDAAVASTDDVSLGDYYERGIDRDATGKIVGFEFMKASRGIVLDGLPRRDELAALFARLNGVRAVA
ncbi:MAG: DUF2283 domain-containing protein [Chloroflexi bacterium]|nr:DUF2283 domain-containing protein [Chloroflexota bacterium]